MFRSFRRAARSVPIRTYNHKQSKSPYSTQSDKHDPLNVLFCGADDFSIYSLRALREYQNVRPDKVANIDVVCRPDKRVGRGLKKIQEVPIKAVANELGLSLHQIDTFKGWVPPDSINLVVAVSFGLLVPARILNGATYGGLNVHPSMLPDLRGPAPIIHTLLTKRSHTGVTLQTMHPTRFDHGTILAQTPSPGITVPSSATPDELLRTLGPRGAEMLCHGIDRSLFVPPLVDVREGTEDPARLDHAAKITPEDRHIDWDTWDVEQIMLRDRVLGRLWDDKIYSRCFPDRMAKRITFQGPWAMPDIDSDTTGASAELRLSSSERAGQQLCIRTVDGRLISPFSATTEGEGKGKGLVALINAVHGS